ncbi:MAG: nucleotidyltransferase family protein [Desulfuromonadales bacterium]
MISEISTIVLAGGKGTRLQTVVADRPKPLALVAGRPFIEYLFDQLSNAGIKQVIVSTGYLGEQIQRQFGETYSTLSLCYSQECVPLGTGGALRHALPLITSQQVLVLNGDSYCDTDIIGLLESHKTKDALVTITTVAVPDISRYGSVTATQEGLVSDFQEKGIKAGTGFINAGIYVIDTSVLDTLAPDTMISLEKEVLPRYIGKSLYAFASNGTFIDIGVPEDYQRAQQLFQRIAKEQQGDE